MQTRLSAALLTGEQSQQSGGGSSGGGYSGGPGLHRLYNRVGGGRGCGTGGHDMHYGSTTLDEAEEDDDDSSYSSSVASSPHQTVSNNGFNVDKS